MEYNEQREFYDRRWDNSNYINKYHVIRLIEILKALHYSKVKNPRILDFGCGTCWLTSILNLIGPTTGIELSKTAIERGIESYPGLNLVQGNIFNYAFEREIFDIVVSQEVIEHVDDQSRYIQLTAKYLKSNGLLILTTPNAYNFNNWDDKKRGNWNLQPIENWLSKKELLQLLYPYFEILDIYTFLPEFGNLGIYKILNSYRLTKLMKYLGVSNLYNKIMNRAGLGLHLFVVGRKKSK